MGRLAAHLLQRIENAEALQQIQGRPHHRLKVRSVALEVLLEQLLLVHETKRLLDTPVTNQR
ncbi:hypothetical protein D3C81_2268940 [compost metagenome]